MDDPSAFPRTAKRSSWPIRKFQLGGEPSADLSASTTPQQRLEMMWPLALEAWALAGRQLPKYSRRETPMVKRPLTSAPTD